MFVKWVYDKPPLGAWGISKQYVVKTKNGVYSTAYFCLDCDKWHCESVISEQDEVLCWLSGLDETNLFGMPIHLESAVA